MVVLLLPAQYDGRKKVRLLPPPVPATYRIGEVPRTTASITSRWFPRKLAAGSQKSCRRALARSARHSRADRQAQRACCSSRRSSYRAQRGTLGIVARPPRPKPKKRYYTILTLRNYSYLAASPVVPC